MSCLNFKKRSSTVIFPESHAVKLEQRDKTKKNENWPQPLYSHQQMSNCHENMRLGVRPKGPTLISCVGGTQVPSYATEMTLTWRDGEGWRYCLSKDTDWYWWTSWARCQPAIAKGRHRKNLNRINGVFLSTRTLIYPLHWFLAMADLCDSDQNRERDFVLNSKMNRWVALAW